MVLAGALVFCENKKLRAAVIGHGEMEQFMNDQLGATTVTRVCNTF